MNFQSQHSFDVAFLDATFFDNNELPGRDMSKVPHPRVRATMERFAQYSDSNRNMINFIHVNHTNGLRDAKSPQSREVRENGFNVAHRGQHICLH